MRDGDAGGAITAKGCLTRPSAVDLPSDDRRDENPRCECPRSGEYGLSPACIAAEANLPISSREIRYRSSTRAELD